MNLYVKLLVKCKTVKERKYYQLHVVKLKMKPVAKYPQIIFKLIFAIKFYLNFYVKSNFLVCMA